LAHHIRLASMLLGIEELHITRTTTSLLPPQVDAGYTSIVVAEDKSWSLMMKSEDPWRTTTRTRVGKQFLCLDFLITCNLFRQKQSASLPNVRCSFDQSCNLPRSRDVDRVAGA
jgi:hypothetical protein